MLIFFILLFFCITVNGSTDKGSPTQWNEHIALCRTPVWYATREDVETAQECKNICDKDHRCLMVKYSKKRMKCWLCDNKSLSPSIKCSVKYDFFIKVDPIPSVLWFDKLGTCKQDKPYKIWFIETAQECKNTCAAEVKCKMVKYSAEERKCFFSSSNELKSSNKCIVEYDFYIKVSQTHAMKWIEHMNLCGNIDSYEVSSARKDEHCKHACAKDSQCFMVMYDPKENYCWKSSSSHMRHSRDCASKLNFYQKDICATMKKDCKDEELCINNGRNHSCLAECPQGYYEEDQTCKDVNECSDKPALCGKSGECFNTPGSYKCICGIGYEWSSEGCIDMNECSKDICGKHAVCKNTVGSYSCTCRIGFTKIEKRCVDVDECRMGVSICSKLAKCINTVGGYSCEDLRVGAGKQPEALSLVKKEKEEKSWVDQLLERVRKKWKPVDTVTEFPEVQTRYSPKYPPTMYTEYPKKKVSTKHPKKMVTPVNGQTPTLPSGTPGKPRVLGTLAVGVTKTPEVVFKELWLSHPQLCLSVSHYENISNVKSEKLCRWKCEQQTKCVMVQYDPKWKKCWLSDDRKMTPKSGCNETFDYYIKGRNECKGKRGKCHRNAVCRASKGRKVCQCVYGFEGDGWSCKDIDECSFYQNLCGNNGECVNTLGSYSCKCKRGFEHKDGKCTKGGSSVRDSSMNQWKRWHGAANSVNVTSVWVLTVISLFACALSC